MPPMLRTCFHVVIAGEGVVGGEDNAVALDVVSTRGANHHHFARASLEQNHLQTENAKYVMTV